MSIPGIDTHPEVPPPLPPPRMPFGNTMPPNHHDLPRHRNDFPSSQSSFASGYGSTTSSLAEDGGRFRRKDLRHAIKEEKDEGYSSWSSTERCDLYVNSHH